jgi:hypothetical protein
MSGKGDKKMGTALAGKRMRSILGMATESEDDDYTYTPPPLEVTNYEDIKQAIREARNAVVDREAELVKITTRLQDELDKTRERLEGDVTRAKDVLLNCQNAMAQLVSQDNLGKAVINLGVPIQQRDYEAVAEIIRSEQMPPKRIAELLGEDRVFAEWFEGTRK